MQSVEQIDIVVINWCWPLRLFKFNLIFWNAMSPCDGYIG